MGVFEEVGQEVQAACSQGAAAAAAAVWDGGGWVFDVICGGGFLW